MVSMMEDRMTAQSGIRCGFLFGALLVMSCMLGCRGMPNASAAFRYPRATEAMALSDFRGEIFIIGVEHAPSEFLSAACSPGHYRAVLEALCPDVVCIKCDPQWLHMGRFYRATYEAQGIAVP
jgi:hypothetical protein